MAITTTAVPMIQPLRIDFPIRGSKWRQNRRLRRAETSPAAVDADRLAGDKRSLIGGEIGDHRGDLVGGAEAADGNRLRALAATHFEIVAIFAPVGADRARGADRAGADRVDRDPVRREVERERPGEADDRRL